MSGEASSGLQFPFFSPLAPLPHRLNTTCLFPRDVESSVTLLNGVAWAPPFMSYLFTQDISERPMPLTTQIWATCDLESIPVATIPGKRKPLLAWSADFCGSTRPTSLLGWQSYLPRQTHRILVSPDGPVII